MKVFKTIDGNEATTTLAYNFSELCGIYPITPASTMAEKADVFSSKGKLNYFGIKVKIIEMQSEAGAVATVHGALQSGVLASTFTASQGLLLMIPTLYKMAGEMLPAVIHVASRSLSTHALSIFGDHQDIYACRMTGVCMLSSSNVEDAYYMAALAHLSAIKSSLPFINFFEGFRTSHEINKIEVLEEDEFKELIDVDALKKFRDKALNPVHPNTRGSAQNDDIYFQNTEVRNKDYDNVPDIVNEYMGIINEKTGTNYKPFNYYGDEHATHIIIAMGSVTDVVKEVIDVMNKDGKHYGLIEVHLYRPFSSKYLLDVLPSSVTDVAVLDRTKEPGSNGEPLYLDVVNVLKDKQINIIGGRYGLSSKNTIPSDIKAVFDNLESDKPLTSFTIGIIDDVTNLSLKRDDNFNIVDNVKEFLFYGYGSDGMVSTSKDIMSIIGDYTSKYVQGYFQYDSKKSGGVTRSHIRISDKPIRKPYYVTKPSFVVVSKDTYMYKYDVLNNIRDNGVFLLNTNLSGYDLIKTLPNKVKILLAKKNLKVYIIDANKIVNELGLKNKISTCMETCIFKIINMMDMEEVKKILKSHNEKRFKHKGENVVEINNKVIDNTLEHLDTLEVLEMWKNLEAPKEEELNFEQTITNMCGNDLPVSAFLETRDGIVQGGNTKYEKRSISDKVPCFIKENCIQCNQCSYVCPHGVIRPFLINDRDELDSIMPKEINFKIGVSYEDCTGCSLCVNECPGKNGNKALEMVDYDKDKFKQDTFEELLKNNKNEMAFNLPMNVRNSQFRMPKFEFHGACAGCGETAYLKNLTQVFGNELVIANATGCSSIYGASSPSMPYSIPWASSLFEDNAEYGFGIKLGFDIERNKIKKYMEENKDELFTKWLDNMDNYNICKEVYDNINYDKHNYLLNHKDAILPKKVFIVGGDGFAYDIGYGGLDHVLSTNEDINILILDTEVYSNTGGQSSKSSNMGSIASFTATGKRNYKKDLFRIATCYPHVYVASVNIGYDKNQYMSALKEAVNHKGPSLIIAYSPCIEHGLRVGMEHSLDNAKLATQCGYYPIMRYNPSDNKFTLDSKKVDFDLYEKFLSTESRYGLNDKELLESQKKWAMNRYEYYQGLEK